jgi:DNA-binding cell septation regulator SpoVG
VHDRISEIQVMFCVDQQDTRVKGFVRLVFDNSYLLGDLRIVETETNGRPRLFLAMPSRYAELRCPHCQGRTPSRGRYCMLCGGALPLLGPGPRDRFHIDTFHPLTQVARQRIEGFVMDRIFTFRARGRWVHQEWYIIFP